jgi:choline dehydrogenase-like flavoprotein
MMRPSVLAVEPGPWSGPAATLRTPLELDTDVVIVGSGAAGSVLAAELAGSGQRVLVVEEGPYLAAGELGRMRPSESMRRGWREAGMTFAMSVGDSPLNANTGVPVAAIAAAAWSCVE